MKTLQAAITLLFEARDIAEFDMDGDYDCSLVFKSPDGQKFELGQFEFDSDTNVMTVDLVIQKT